MNQEPLCFNLPVIVCFSYANVLCCRPDVFNINTEYRILILTLHQRIHGSNCLVCLVRLPHGHITNYSGPLNRGSLRTDSMDKVTNNVSRPHGSITQSPANPQCCHRPHSRVSIRALWRMLAIPRSSSLNVTMSIVWSINSVMKTLPRQP